MQWRSPSPILKNWMRRLDCDCFCLSKGRRRRHDNRIPPSLPQKTNHRRHQTNKQDNHQVEDGPVDRNKLLSVHRTLGFLIITPPKSWANWQDDPCVSKWRRLFLADLISFDYTVEGLIVPASSLISEILSIKDVTDFDFIVVLTKNKIVGTIKNDKQSSSLDSCTIFLNRNWWPIKFKN